MLSKLREITSCSSDPQHVTLFAKIEEAKTWISLEARLDFQTQKSLSHQAQPAAFSSAPWPGIATTQWCLHQPPPPHSQALEKEGIRDAADL